VYNGAARGRQIGAWWLPAPCCYRQPLRHSAGDESTSIPIYAGSKKVFEPKASKKKIVALAVVAAWTASSAAIGNCAPIQCSAPIQAITITDDAVYIRLVGDTVGLTNCTAYSGSYITLPKTGNPNFTSYYAAVLAAYVAKESITLRTVDGSPNCAIAYIALP